MKFPLLAPLLLAMGMLFPAASVSASGPFMETGAGAALLKIDFQVKAEHLPAFMKIMATVDRDMRGEAGFIRASVMVHQDDRHHITLLEVWETRALHESHYAAIVANGTWAQILSMQASAPQMGYYTVMKPE